MLCRQREYQYIPRQNFTVLTIPSRSIHDLRGGTEPQGLSPCDSYIAMALNVLNSPSGTPISKPSQERRKHINAWMDDGVRSHGYSHGCPVTRGGAGSGFRFNKTGHLRIRRIVPCVSFDELRSRPRLKAHES
jgi:hypothetical protein